MPVHHRRRPELSPHWTGGGPTRRFVLAELEPQGDMDWWVPVNRGPMKSLLSGRFHYILNGDGTEELYDIVDDYELPFRSGFDSGRGCTEWLMT